MRRYTTVGEAMAQGRHVIISVLCPECWNCADVIIPRNRTFKLNCQQCKNEIEVSHRGRFKTKEK